MHITHSPFYILTFVSYLNLFKYVFIILSLELIVCMYDYALYGIAFKSCNSFVKYMIGGKKKKKTEVSQPSHVL